MARSDRLWLDSDVILDWLASRQPWDAAATEIIRRAILGHWELWFSPLTIANVHYVYRKQAGAFKAIAAVRSLVQVGNIATLCAAHINQALAVGQRDFEDEIQIACASGVPGLSAIITRNIADYMQCAPPAMTAESWLKQNSNLAP